MITRKSGVALHYQIRKHVENLLKKDKASFINGDVLPTEEKISQDFNVSRGTVRRAISDLVNEGILYRVPGKGTFLAKEGKHQKEITIFSSWQFLDEDLSFFSYESVLFKGIHNALHQAGYSLSMKHFDEDEVAKTLEDDVFKNSGVIIVNPRRNKHQELMHKMALMNIPFVVAGANIGWEGINCISVDNTNGIKKAVDYLVSLGHKKISYAGASIESYDSYERFESFRVQCRINRLSDRYGKIFTGEKDWKDEFEDLFLKWKENRDYPTAIIAGGASISLMVIEIMRKYKRKIPEDFSLIGFDDFPSASHLQPPLTVIKQPVYEMGKEAVSLLLKAIDNSSLKEMKILPTELIIRNSCTKNTKGGNENVQRET